MPPRPAPEESAAPAPIEGRMGLILLDFDGSPARQFLGKYNTELWHRELSAPLRQPARYHSWRALEARETDLMKWAIGRARIGRELLTPKWTASGRGGPVANGYPVFMVPGIHRGESQLAEGIVNSLALLGQDAGGDEEALGCQGRCNERSALADRPV